MNEFLIEETKDYVRDALKDESNGHDYFHALRVFNNANNIAQDYKCDLLVVRLAALLHDVDDYKILGGRWSIYQCPKVFVRKTIT